jgi:hypothetical protein
MMYAPSRALLAAEVVASTDNRQRACELVAVSVRTGARGRSASFRNMSVPPNITDSPDLLNAWLGIDSLVR